MGNHFPGKYKCRLCRIGYKTLNELSNHYQEDMSKHYNSHLASVNSEGKIKLWETNGRDENGVRDV